MKGRALILIFLFLLLIIFPVSADFTNGGFETGDYTGWTKVGSGDVQVDAAYSNNSNYGISVNEHSNDYTTLWQTIDLTGIDEISFDYRVVERGSSLCYPFNVELAGHGTLFYDWTVGGWKTQIVDVSGYTGVKTIYFTSYGSLAHNSKYYLDNVKFIRDKITLNKSSYNDPEDVQMDAELADYDPTSYSYTTRLYGYTYGGWGALTQVEYNESTVMTATTKSITADIDASWYDLPLQIKAVLLQFNKGDYTTTEIAESDAVYYHVADGYTYATVEFNQSYYTDPEQVAVNYTIDGMDLANFEYWIEVLGNDGEWTTWLGVNEEYLELDSSSGQSVFTINQQWLTLPMNIKAYLYAYNKATGTTSTLATTSTVSYSPGSIAPGSVWTNKDSYNVTEVVTIYTDTNGGGYLMIDKRNDSLYDSFTISSGLSNVKFSLQSSHVGIWDVYLYEDSIMTNSTVFTVLADDDVAYFSWWGSVQKGEAAYYDYVATSSNSVIRIYDHLGTKQYSFNATPGYNEGQISTMPGVAGNWTGSLYDNGVYYNSSLEVYASESWIRFVDDAYYMGDTIEIEYFIVDPEYKIYLRDGLCQYGGRTTIVTWTPGSFHTGQRGTLEFTLSNDNEFGLQVETNFESGSYLPGTWMIEAAGMTDSGYRSTDDITYVCARGKTDADDYADTSNEMISLFFSPQGLFMIFTAALTMMGLVAVKHPAGGGAGAVVGVGFGVFFNVLPEWMLILTVITLVVLAGVTIAVHFKGK